MLLFFFYYTGAHRILHVPTHSFPTRRSSVLHGVLLLIVVLGNTSFLGYPLVRALLGESALPYAVVYDQFGAFMLLSTFGLYVLARYGGERKPRARDIALRMLRFPPFLALLFALTVMPVDPPTFIAHGLVRLADALRTEVRRVGKEGVSK